MLFNDLKKLVDEQYQSARDETGPSLARQMESYFSLRYLRGIFERRDFTRRAELFLKNRWKRIQETGVQYCQDYTNPANIASIALAKYLSARLDKPYLLYLMPSLAKIPTEAYTSSSYADPDLCLRECIISDDLARIIHIPDALSNAQNYAVLHHNSLMHGKMLLLTPAEKSRLLGRHPLVRSCYTAIESLYVFKFYGESFGAALQRLAQGLRSGGAHSSSGAGTEYDAGQNANTAILEFGEYLDRLDTLTKASLFTASFEVDYRRSGASVITLAYIWDNLLINPDKTKAVDLDADSLTSEYCVEVLAGYIEKILESNLHLYDMFPFESQAVSGFASLKAEVKQGLQAVEAGLKELAHEPSTFYAKTEERQLYSRLVDFFANTEVPWLRQQELRGLLSSYKAGPNSSEQQATMRTFIRLLNASYPEHAGLVAELLPEFSASLCREKPYQSATASAGMFRSKREAQPGPLVVEEAELPLKRHRRN